MDIKAIAFHLPQFHPIPENDEWWGKGFSEWTNVAKARPLFKGHRQPIIPGELGFYDMRLEETRLKQIRIAKENGIYGFSYWHYWFHGKQVLENPVERMLKNKKEDFPFCLSWANETWSGIWHGQSNKILLTQEYSTEDHVAHFNYLLPFFKDPRYILVDNKPMFIIYRPLDIPDFSKFKKMWNDLAKENGLNGIYFVGVNKDSLNSEQYEDLEMNMLINNASMDYGIKKLRSCFFVRLIRHILKLPMHIYKYKNIINYINESNNIMSKRGWYPVLFSNWDNTPRSGHRGVVLTNPTKDLFKKSIISAVSNLENLSEKFIFIKSWNEWAEGNYLEPEMEKDKFLLDAVKEVLSD